MKKKCAALVPSQDYQELWMPCTNPRAGKYLCQAHQDALAGILFGLDNIDIGISLLRTPNLEKRSVDNVHH
jgi:hypothetical protein